jgi:hypothetical protein
MSQHDLSAIRARLAAGEHLSAEEWRLLMEHDQFAHQIADLTLEYLAARVGRRQAEQHRESEWATAT